MLTILETIAEFLKAYHDVVSQLSVSERIQLVCGWILLICYTLKAIIFFFPVVGEKIDDKIEEITDVIDAVKENRKNRKSA